jgi:hypothetical protein
MLNSVSGATVIWAQNRGRGGKAVPVAGCRAAAVSAALLRIEAVQRELELIDDQIEAIRKLEEELRSQRRPGESEAGPCPENMSDKKSYAAQGAICEDGRRGRVFARPEMQPSLS